MMRGIILVISLGGIKGLQWDDLSHNRAGENLGPLQLRDVRLGDSLLLVAAIENRRAILAARVRPLPVQLRRVVRD